MIAFSVGSFVLAPVAVPLAQRYGRFVLVAGAALMAVGEHRVDIGAHHVGGGSNPGRWCRACSSPAPGLGLLVVPLVNVVLAAVPGHAAGGASGLFSTAQQLGGALGVAAIGTVFFGFLDGHNFQAAFEHTVPLTAIAFAISGLLALVLPKTAIAEEPDAL